MRPRTPFPLKFFAKKIAGKKTSRLAFSMFAQRMVLEYDW